MNLRNYNYYKLICSTYVKSSRYPTISYYVRAELCESLALHYGAENAYMTKTYNCITVNERFQIFAMVCNGGHYEVSIHDMWNNENPNVNLKFDIEIDPDEVIYALDNWDAVRERDFHLVSHQRLKSLACNCPVVYES